MHFMRIKPQNAQRATGPVVGFIHHPVIQGIRNLAAALVKQAFLLLVEIAPDFVGQQPKPYQGANPDQPDGNAPANRVRGRRRHAANRHQCDRACRRQSRPRQVDRAVDRLGVFLPHRIMDGVDQVRAPGGCLVPARQALSARRPCHWTRPLLGPPVLMQGPRQSPLWRPAMAALLGRLRIGFPWTASRK